MPTPRQSSRTVAIAMMLGAALLWSAGGVIIKTASVSPMALAGWRSLFALPVLGLAACLRAQEEPQSATQALRSSWMGMAVASYVLMVVTFVVATRRTTAANAVFIQYTSIAHVAILSWPVLRERIGWREGVACAGVLAGLVMFFGDRLAIASDRAQSGNVLAFVSSLGAAAVVLAIRRGLRTPSGGTSTSAMFPAITFAAGNVLTLVVCGPWMLASVPRDAQTWALLAAMGTLQVGVSYLLYTVAVSRLTALESSIASTLDPILNPVWVLLATGERPSRLALIGGVFVIGSVVLLAAPPGPLYTATR
jgi:drug/metabolite transporter (DMT)-like permease